MKSLLLSFLVGYLSSVFALTGGAKDVQPYPFEVQVSGQGTRPIVFIPGFASAGSVWEETVGKLGKEFRCHTLTMAGFAGVRAQPGASFKSWEAHTLTMAGFAGVRAQPGASFKSWEASIAKYFKDNHLEKAIVVGHSMGGVMGLALAADYPELVGKIVVVDALPCLAAMSNPNFQASEKPDCTSMVAQMTNLSVDQFRQMQLMSVRSMVADTTRQKRVVAWSVASDRTTLGEMFCDFMNTDLRDKLGAIQCPTLVLLQPYFKNIAGAIDSQYKNLKNANLRYATKGLHFIMFDDQEWYMKELSQFIHAQ